MTREEVDQFEKLTAQLVAAHQEVSALSKKSPKDAVNVFKLKLINSTLERCNAALGSKYMPFDDFSTFPLEDLPSNSDVSFIIAHYLEAAEKFRSDHIVQVAGGRWQWHVDDGNPIRTASPKKLNDK